ncbi:MAG: hypothetical protein ACMUIP_06045 [bacterium]
MQSRPAKGDAEDDLDYPSFMRRKDTSEGTSASPLFRGTPKFVNNEAVIFDIRRKEDEKKLIKRTTFSSLKVEFLEDMAELSLIDAAISLHFYTLRHQGI